MLFLSQYLTSRRRLLRQLGFLSLSATLPLRRIVASANTPAPAGNTAPVVRNRAPLAPSAFYFLPVGSIRPQGWLRNQLQIQANGLSGHLDEVTGVLDSAEPAGRRLDFLMQELNREANTLSSKSQDVETTRAAVDMKVMIEQMREQVQNVE